MGDYLYNPGSHTRSISTVSERAQTWFDRGLNWVYGYNHEEAAECFRNALKHDPDCVMAHWGMAYIIGPNYNRPWERFGENELQTMLSEARASLAAAQVKLDMATPVEPTR